jgi:hypothetical protein
MIVWGGARPARGENERFLRDGAAYDPRSDRWRRIARAPILPQLGRDAEPDATEAVWTGRQMIVWNGGLQGAAYDPARDTWRRIPRAPLESKDPSGTDSAVWTGEELIVWGGVRGGNDFLEAGAAYDPDTGRWQLLPDSPLRGRDRHVAIWTGDAMLVWGGCCRGSRYFSDGALYTPA